jgi:hypothetical protein
MTSAAGTGLRFEAGMADPVAQPSDVTRRTWLAWWRSGLAVGAVALAVGRFLPEVTRRETTWPFKALGLSVASMVLVVTAF